MNSALYFLVGALGICRIIGNDAVCFPSGFCMKSVDSENFGKSFGAETHSEGQSIAEFINGRVKAGAIQTAAGRGPGESGAETGARTIIDSNFGPILMATTGGSSAKGAQTSSQGQSFTNFENGVSSFGSEHSASASGSGHVSSSSFASLKQQQGKRRKRGTSAQTFLYGQFRSGFFGPENHRDIFENLYDKYGSSSFGLSNKGQVKRLSGRVASSDWSKYGGLFQNRNFGGGRIDSYDRNGYSSMAQDLSAQSFGNGFSDSWGDIWSNGQKSFASSGSSASVRGFGDSKSQSKVGSFNSRFGQNWRWH